jgi:hypothetical protein
MTTKDNNQEMKKSEGEDFSKDGFVVPDYYFERLKKNIESEIFQPKTGTRNHSLKIWNYVAAASIVLLIGFSVAIYQKLESKNIDSTKTSEIALMTNSKTNNQVQNMDSMDKVIDNPKISNTQVETQESIDNAIIEVTEDMDLSDEEFVELVSSLEI